jgi:TonB family protein
MRCVPGLLACVFAVSLCAQTIGGRVFDQTGAVVSGARVVLLEDFNKIAETRSGDSGEFAFRGLKAGTYQVQVKQPWFQIFQQLVQLQEDRTARVYATLNVARAEDVVGIAASHPLGPRPAGAVEAYRPGGKVAGLKRLSGRMPAWPPGAAARGASGTVVLCGTVKADGTIAGVTVLESPDEDLSKAAAEAYGTWKFEPMKLNGQPVEARHLLVLEFGS